MSKHLQVPGHIAADLEARKQLGDMRINLAGSIVPRLAAIDYERVVVNAIEERDRLGRDPDTPLDIEINALDIGEIATAYADGVLVALGLATIIDDSTEKP